MEIMADLIDFDVLFWASNNYSNFSASDSSCFSSGQTSDQQRTASAAVTSMEIVYAVFESIVATCSICGNCLIAASYLRDRRLRTHPTNAYIFSLSLTDLMVSAVGIPIYLYSMITSWPTDRLSCLLVNTWILMLCTVSIFHLLAVSYDRYSSVVWATRRPTIQQRNRRTVFLITTAWILGATIGFLPLMGWNDAGSGDPGGQQRCDFMEIMDMRYLMFLFFATIITPTILMAFFYASIFNVVRRQSEKMRHRQYMELNENCERDTKKHSKTDGRLVTDNDTTDETDQHQEIQIQIQHNDKKTTTQISRKKRVIVSLLLVIVCFLVCWFPLYTLNAVVYYCPKCRIDQIGFYICIVLSHLSSAINPFIYARTMPGFREAFKETLRCVRRSKDDKKTEITRIKIQNHRRASEISIQRPITTAINA